MKKPMIYICSAAAAMTVMMVQPMTSMAGIRTCVISGNGQGKIVIRGGKNQCMENAVENNVIENENTDWAMQVVELVNAERAKAGLTPLKMNQKAANAAKVRAREISSVFSHSRPNGKGFQTALDDAGVSYRSYGENIAYGQKSPQAVMNQWMNSSGHRANILNPNFTEIGVGHYKTADGVDYWTQLFIR